MMRSFKYLLKPTGAQDRRLREWLHLTRELYNCALEHRRGAWRKQHTNISCWEQQAEIPSIREVRPEFNDMPVWIMRGALRRLDLAFSAFYRRCKSGETPGYPRFKPASRWRSMMIEDLGLHSPIVAGGKRVKIPLLGKVKFKQHRPTEGKIKTMKLALECGRWFVILTCIDIPEKPLEKTGANIGIDLGLTHFVATSDGELFSNPHLLKNAQRALTRAQRKVSKRGVKGGSRRRQAKQRLARRHLHVVNVRRECHITIARALVAKYDVICVEALDINAMVKGWFGKPIQDVAWGGLLHWIRVKAESAGREVVEVNPRGTSQTCSGCGVEVKKTIAVRIHECSTCGLSINRDINAARNVLRLGLSLRGAALLQQRSAKPKSTRLATASGDL